jgi:GH15 family glucan-1,4-alpha-glucosidase
MTKRIEDYALIGDCETAALVSRNGSIDWLCWPRFDSGAVFANLLGTPDNGHWSISPVKPARVARRYRGHSLILETDFATDDGEVTLIDFMPLRFQQSQSNETSHLVRIVRGRRGTVSMATEITLRFEYGSVVPWVRRIGDDVLLAVAGPDLVVFQSSVPVEAQGMRHRGTFTVAAGADVVFSLGYGPSYGTLPPAVDPFIALKATQKTWEEWIGQCHEFGEHADAVKRSLVTLKALTYRPTGGIVAAPTTSLPETLGGGRNWDYRFCWLRDATFTLLALMTSGFHREAAAWRGWLRRAVAGDPAAVQIMYGLAGERRLIEWEVPWLAGYAGAHPVRIGNAAAGQLQLDIYGEVLDALYQASAAGLAQPSSDWDLQCAMVEHLEAIWPEPDEGIWEVRGGRRHFTHSKVMAWVAFDRAVKSIEKWSLPGPLERWRTVRDTIHDEICRKAYHPDVGAFVQFYGSSNLDASALLIPLVGFLPPSDARVQSTIAAIERDLMEEGLVLRYRPEHTEDGLKTREGAFLACSFWLVDNLVLLGRNDEARQLFERLLALRNDVGLLAEEYDSYKARQVGNFPQAFSHVALINSAYNLHKAATHKKPAEQRAHHRVGVESARKRPRGSERRGGQERLDDAAQ